MCGRYSFSRITGLVERFQIERIEAELVPRYNIAPGQLVPAVVNTGEKRLTLLRWGLIPYWAKDKLIGNWLINARAETLSSKPSFRACLEKRRCLVLADGFYEWQGKGRSKKPYRFQRHDGEPFAFAGLWDTWRSPSGEVLQSCTIITTAADKLVAPVHQRMPVVLPAELEPVWLDHSVTDSRFLQDLLQPCLPDRWLAYEVSSLVNSPANDIPDCLVPAGAAPSDSLF